jgi:uncharacterized protein (UPF0335 family)
MNPFGFDGDDRLYLLDDEEDKPELESDLDIFLRRNTKRDKRRTERQRVRTSGNRFLGTNRGFAQPRNRENRIVSTQPELTAYFERVKRMKERREGIKDEIDEIGEKKSKKFKDFDSLVNSMCVKATKEFENADELPVCHEYDYKNNDGIIKKVNPTMKNFRSYQMMVLKNTADAFKTIETWNNFCKFWRYGYTNQFLHPGQPNFFMLKGQGNSDEYFRSKDLARKMIELNSYNLIISDFQDGGIERIGNKVIGKRAFIKAFAPEMLADKLVQEFNRIEAIYAYTLNGMDISTGTSRRERRTNCINNGLFVTYEGKEEDYEGDPGVYPDEPSRTVQLVPMRFLDLTPPFELNRALSKEIFRLKLMTLVVVDTAHEDRGILYELMSDLLKKHGQKVD